MCARVVGRVLMCVVAVMWLARHASAQPPAAAEPVHQHESGDVTSSAMATEASGTSWLPQLTPMYALHGARGDWTFMGHGNAFIQYLNEQGDRGSEQTGSINWAMAMAEHPLGRGRLQLRTMFSLEPWTIGGCGYPDLLASGERCDGQKIHDQQHPHDLAMELAAALDVPIAGGVRWQGYAGAVGEPALGPVAFPHRISAMSNPLAPITHHWLDSTHITFGVATVGVYGRGWKVEGSAFNGREPDEQRTDFDNGRWDSYSGRLWILPAPSFAFQVSAGKLKDAEPGEEGGDAADVQRVTASATYHRVLSANGIWATTAAWGRNTEEGDATDGALIETNLIIADRDSLYARFETGVKSGHDLALSEDRDTFTVAKLQAGYTRYFAGWRSFKAGLGVTASMSQVPQPLTDTYGARRTAGFGAFFTFRPAGMLHTSTAQVSTGAATVVSGAITSMSGGHVMVQTADGPAMVMIDATTAITRAGAAVEASTLKAGDRVVVTGSGGRDMLAAKSIEVGASPAP